MNDFAILLFNCVCISLLFLMSVALVAGTKMKGCGQAAWIIFIGTIPTHCYNMFRSIGYLDVAVYLYAIAITNTLLLPLLWLFVKRQLNPFSKFRMLDTFHFLPTIINFVFLICGYIFLSYEEKIVYIELESKREFLWMQFVNDLIVFGQMFVYFPLMFLFLRKTKKELDNAFPAVEFLHLRCVQRFMILYTVLFFMVFVGYVINSHTDAWLIPILNIVLVTYLVYQCIVYPTDIFFEQYKEALLKKEEKKNCVIEDEKKSVVLSEERMNFICEKITDYLYESKAYTDSALSIWSISQAIDITPSDISKSINGCLRKNFFDLINRMRIDEAKNMLLSSQAETMTIDGIARECGFRSRSSFYTAFKKYENKTPKEWIKSNENLNLSE